MDIDTNQTQQPSQPSLYGASLSRGGSAGAAAAANAAASTPAAAGATEGEHISRRRWEGLAAAARVTDELPADDDAAAAAAATTLGGDEIPAPHLRASHHPSGFTGLDESYTRDPARLQDENYANIFAHFLQTYRREPGEADDDDENAPWPEDPVLEAQRPATGDAAGSALSGGPVGEAYYMRAMANLLQDAHARRTLVVKLHDVERWQPEGAPVHDAGMRLAEHIRRNYIRIRCRLQDVFRLLMEKLAQQLLAAPLQYTFFLQLRDTAPKYIHEIGSLRCNMLGRLLSVRGQVTRSTDVRPELLRASFKCLECGYIEHDVEQCFRYTQPKQCRNTTCNNTINWELMMERSQCGDWQKLRVQEPSGSSSGSNSNRRSPSSVPRSIDLILRHDLVDSVYAGDIIIASGALIAIPDVAALVTRPGQVPRRDRPRRNEATLGVAPLRGLSSLGVREMQFKICMLVIDVQPEEINGGIGGGGLAAAAGGGRHDPLAAAADSREVYQAADFLGSGSFDWLREVAEAPDTLDRLVKSVAPRVWGYEDVKKGILLLMTGGVQKATANARLRGDINMCLVGDPSTSKSQLLSWVTSFAPRSVFASGKGSTAAGLTAAVVRDSDQGDYVLEAGALMYADQGICCIDEFDKMDEKDRVAIHEAMEQQTISISKAGIQATLNARASVLAACNPRFGRYDKSKSFSANVNIPPPLLSRFDLFFTLLDEACDTRDAAVFDHVVSFHLTDEAQRELHQRKAAAAAAESQTVIPLTADELRVYIQCAQKLKPLLTDEAKVKLAKTYTALRLADAQPGMQQNTRITVRQLESLVRLSEAVARLKFSDFVREEHVDEAVRIFRASLQRIVYSSDIVLQEEEQQQQQSSALSSSGAAAGAAATAATNTDERAAAGGAGGAAKSIRISQEEYRRISCQFIEYISRAEREADISTHTIFEGVRSSSLIEWWLDEILQADDPAALEGWAHKLLLIIRRLVAHDGYLVAETIEGEEEELLLRVHPNLSEDFYDVNQLQFHAGRGGGSRAVLGGSRLVPPAAGGGAAAAADPSSSPSPHLSAAAAAGGSAASSQQSPRRPGAGQQRATAAAGKARRGAAAAARGTDVEADQEGEDEEDDELMMADLTQENFEQLEEHTQQTQTQTLDDY